MQAFAVQVWNPWLAYGLLALAAIVTLATVFPQLRGWRWAKGALRGEADEDPAPVPLAMAASAGVASIAGTALAMTLGGPGALVWAWLAIVLGLGVHFAEGLLGARARRGDESARIHLLAAPGVGTVLAPFFAVGVVGLMVVIAGLLASNETSSVLEHLGGPAPKTTAIAIAVAAAPVVLWSQPRRWAFRAVPFVVAVYALCALVVAFGDPLVLQLGLGDAMNGAVGVQSVAGGVAGGSMGLAIFHGVSKAAAAGATGGLGVGALAGIRSASPRNAGAAAMVAAIGSAAILTTATGFVMLSRGAIPKVVAANELIPLEQVHSRGLRPSQQVGQTIVLPADTPMVDKGFYGVLLRSSPRGHAWAKLDPELNAVVMPAWKVTDNTHTVAFRSLNPEGAKQAAWDVRVECNREVREGPGGIPYLKLTPKDPNLDMHVMTRQLSLAPIPYVMLDDFHFVGRVAEATSGDESLGLHLAMFEAPNAERPFNPKLHEFFRNGYRGPYADDGQPRPPWTFVAAEGFAPEIGRVVRLRLAATERGARAVAVSKSGTAESPPWRLLLSATELVLRHDTDPSQDIHIPVTPRLDDFRVRYDVVDKRFEDLRAVLENNPQVKGPYVVVPDQEFEVEVRGDTRLPPELRGRRALVPLHAVGEPQGPLGEELPYDPHPAELLDAGFSGPYVTDEGAVMVATQFDTALGGFGRLVIAATMVLLTIASLGAWAELGGRAAAALLGSVGPMVARVGALLAVGAGAYATRTQLWSIAELVLALVLSTSLLGLVLLLGPIRERLAREPKAD
jgi:Na+/alanine symporter